jgi:hypothetical protein
MSYISKHCEDNMKYCQKEVDDLFEIYKTNYCKQYELNNIIEEKLKRLAYMDILCSKIKAEHDEIYKIKIEDCLCNLCCGGYQLFYESPMLKLSLEIKNESKSKINR